MNKKASDRLIGVLFPKKKFKEYLERFKIQSLKKAEKSVLEKLFIRIVEDFMKGKIGFDEFSSISNYLWWHGGVMARKEHEDKEFYNILQQAGELSFYIRSESEDVRRLSLSVLNQILGYYKKSSKKVA